MIGRISCCVPFCGRTCKRGETTLEWICSRHWMMVPKYRRRRDSKLVRLYIKRFGKNGYWTYPAGSPKRIEAVRLSNLCDKSWAILKRQAIERAAGI